MWLISMSRYFATALTASQNDHPLTSISIFQPSPPEPSFPPEQHSEFRQAHPPLPGSLNEYRSLPPQIGQAVPVLRVLVLVCNSDKPARVCRIWDHWFFAASFTRWVISWHWLLLIMAMASIYLN